MFKIRKSIIAIVAFAIISVMMLSGGMTTFAAGASISFSDPSVVVGKEVSVKMKVKSGSGSYLGKVEVMLSYDPDMLEFVSGSSASGGAGSVRISGSSNSTDADTLEFLLSFKANQAGTVKLAVTTQEIYDVNSQLLSVESQGSSTITVSALESYSNVAELKELIISPGTLTPAFSPDVTEYRAAVEGSISKVAVSAIPKADGKAKVTITGNDELLLGENKVLCKVTAEDGTTVKTYTITIDKGAAGEADSSSAATQLQVTINGELYHIASSWSESSLPEGFEKQSYTYQGESISVGKGLEKNLILTYLISPSNQGAFYIYDEVSDAFTPYIQLETIKKAIVILAPDPQVNLPQGFVESAVSIDNQVVQGWVWASESNHEYCIFYAMNWNGEKGFYRYDTKEKTIQRYFQDPALNLSDSDGTSNSLSDTYQQLQKQYQRRFMLILVLIFLAVALFAVTVYLLFKKGRRDLNYDHDFEEDDIDGKIPYTFDRNELYDATDEEEYYSELEDETELETKLAQETEVVLVLDSDVNEELEVNLITEELDDDFEIVDLDD